ncbi:MAG: hypothetical protein J0L84_19520 [Verrucomicrobia bacterium]|nr:hypothetical protein [Verrucomicrobiota bacterium]
MKRRRKVELLVEDIHRAIATEDPKLRRERLSSASWDVSRLSQEILSDPLKLGSLLTALRSVRDAGGPGSNSTEREMLNSLRTHLSVLSGRFTSDEDETDEEDPGEDDGEGKQGRGVMALDAASSQVLQLLGGYAMDCLQFSRPRDAFGGERRELAFEILGIIRRHLPMPEAEQKAVATLATSDGHQARGAIEFLRRLFQQDDTAPAPALTGALMKLVERTQDRSVAFGALDLLVYRGVISEFQALDHLDSWKAKHR